jgi:hypothetical protein
MHTKADKDDIFFRQMTKPIEWSVDDGSNISESAKQVIKEDSKPMNSLETKSLLGVTPVETKSAMSTGLDNTTNTFNFGVKPITFGDKDAKLFSFTAPKTETTVNETKPGFAFISNPVQKNQDVDVKPTSLFSFSKPSTEKTQVKDVKTPENSFSGTFLGSKSSALKENPAIVFESKTASVKTPSSFSFSVPKSENSPASGKESSKGFSFAPAHVKSSEKIEDKPPLLGFSTPLKTSPAVGVSKSVEKSKQVSPSFATNISTGPKSKLIEKGSIPSSISVKPTEASKRQVLIDEFDKHFLTLETDLQSVSFD